MRVLKKISTPFTQARPDKAIIVVNLVDPQVNTIKAFLQACRDYKIHYRMIANKIDRVPDCIDKIDDLKEKFSISDIVGVSAKSGKNVDIIKKQIESWKNSRTIFLGVFNSGKTSLINVICGTKYRVADIPGTTLEFTETVYNSSVIVDSVGQLIDIDKPMMISIDFSGCTNIDEKIDRVFDKETMALIQTKESAKEQIREVIPVIIKCIKKGRKIIVTGAGASGLVAKAIAGQGTECGLPIMVFTNDGAETQPVSFSKGIGEQEGGLSKYMLLAVNKGDCVIGVSASSGTGFVYELLRLSKKKGAITIAITENPDAPVGHNADYIIKSSGKPEGPSSSKIMVAHLCVGHTLMLTIADEMGVTADESVGYMNQCIIESKLMGIK